MQELKIIYNDFLTNYDCWNENMNWINLKKFSENFSP
jgi:hypothetical protein